MASASQLLKCVLYSGQSKPFEVQDLGFFTTGLLATNTFSTQHVETGQVWKREQWRQSLDSFPKACVDLLRFLDPVGKILLVGAKNIDKWTQLEYLNRPAMPLGLAVPKSSSGIVRCWKKYRVFFDKQGRAWRPGRVFASSTESLCISLSSPALDDCCLMVTGSGKRRDTVEELMTACEGSKWLLQKHCSVVDGETNELLTMVPMYSWDFNKLATNYMVTDQLAAYMLYAVSKGLETIHGAGFIHKDIKLCNMLINLKNPQTAKKEDYYSLDSALFPSLPNQLVLTDIVLGDFGLACSQESKGTYSGTSLYIAPEVVERKHSSKSDIYSLALNVMALYGRTRCKNTVKWLTREFQRSWGDHNTPGICPRSVHEEDMHNLSKLEAPSSIKRLLKNMMAEDPRDRYSARRVAAEAPKLPFFANLLSPIDKRSSPCKIKGTSSPSFGTKFTKSSRSSITI